MGRSYAYECPKCGLQAKVSGGADRGVLVWVQTISCRECKKLYDAVTRLKTDALPEAEGKKQMRGRMGAPPALSLPDVLGRLRPTGQKRFRWFSLKLQCPISPQHRVEGWNDPGHCPKCGTYLEKSALPYRLWE